MAILTTSACDGSIAQTGKSVQLLRCVEDGGSNPPGSPEKVVVLIEWAAYLEQVLKERILRMCQYLYIIE